MATRKSFFASLGTGVAGALLGYRTGSRRTQGSGAAVAPAGVAHVDVRASGARGDDNLTHDHGVIADCLAQSKESGLPVYFPPGTYRIDEIVLDWDGAAIHGAGMGVILRARDHDQALIRVSASKCVIGDLTLDAAGHRGVHGLVMAPRDESARSVRADQNFNRIRRMEILGCEDGMRLRPGPTVRRADSGIFYNSFYDIHCWNCVRGIWLQAGLGATGANRNRWYSIRVGMPSTNTGIQIDDGNTNNWFGIGLEGVQNATGPNRPATALIVNGRDARTVLNRFYGLDIEASPPPARWIYNDNPTTEFHGAVAVHGQMAGAYPRGGLWLNAAVPWDGSTAGHLIGTPVTVPATRQSGGVQTGVAHNRSFDITIPTRRPVRLELMSNANPTTMRICYIASDGVNNPAITNLLDTTSDMLAVSAVRADTVRVTNRTGFTVAISWSLVVSSDGI